MEKNLKEIEDQLEDLQEQKNKIMQSKDTEIQEVAIEKNTKATKSRNLAHTIEENQTEISEHSNKIQKAEQE
jgi:hypothetical protein